MKIKHRPKFKKIKRTNSKSGVTKSTPSIEILCPVLDLDRNESFYRVRFTDLLGDKRIEDISRTAFAKRNDAIDILLGLHADLPDDRAGQKKCIDNALAARDKSQATLYLTERVGWEQSCPNPSFVFHNRTFGPKKKTLTYKSSTPRNPALGMSAGSLEGWKSGIAEACNVSDYLILSVSIAAAGPLYDLCPGAEPTIFHYQGAEKPSGSAGAWASASGKTTSARICASTYGRASTQDLFGFDTTQAGLEETCASSNNLAVVLDEEGGSGGGHSGNAIDPKRLPYLIVNGRSRTRSQRGGNAFKNLTWTVPVITTSEDPLDPGGTSSRKEGAQVRMIAIPFPPTHLGGMFDQASPDEGRRLAQQLEATISENYGVAMPAYLDRLANNRETLTKEVPTMIEEFNKSVLGDTTDNWERRYASKFGMVVAGSRLLARYNVAPWPEEHAVAAISRMYARSRALTVSVPQATDAFFKRIGELVQQRKHITRLEKGSHIAPKKAKKLWGVIRSVGGKKNVTVLRWSRFANLVSPPAVAEKVLEKLGTDGRLVKSPTGELKRQILITELTQKRYRYVCIRGLVKKRPGSSKGGGKPKGGRKQ